MNEKNKAILLKTRPQGKPTLENFETVDRTIPEAGGNEMLIQLTYVSVDPYLRGRMNDAKSYIPPFVVGDPVASGAVGHTLSAPGCIGFDWTDSLPWIAQNR